MKKIKARPNAVKYLSNKELLAEIARCKVTFCTFVSPEYSEYDAIVHDLSLITSGYLEELINRLNGRLEEGETPRDENGLVFRLMTYDHIPLDPDRKRKSRATNQSHAQTNFPPFKHYVLRDGEYIEVGRSHWDGVSQDGNFSDGEFSLIKGRMTERLGLMFYKLVEKYSMRSNWRSYCYDDQTQLLTKRGWLSHDEITMDDIALSYNMDDGHLIWSKINHIYRDHYDGNMFQMSVIGLDALVTPGHKFITDSGLKEAELLKETDRIILMGNSEKTTHEKIYDDAFVELVGWVVTEGSFYHRKGGSKTPRLTIYQNEGGYADRIRDCITKLGSKHSEFGRIRCEKVCISFALRNELTLKLLKVIDGVDRKKKILNRDFICALTDSQRDLLIETMIDGDGWRTIQRDSLKVGYVQRDKEHMDAFAMLCTLAGRQISVGPERLITQRSGKVTPIYDANIFSDRRRVCRVENVDMHGAKRNGTTKGLGKDTHPNEPTIPYSGTVWCVQSDYGTLVVRRGRYIYTCSNTYRDEMVGLALMHLSQVGLQFDESKSSNPFAFFTTTITHTFTRTLNLEKKNQNIRDDLLIQMGMAPSYTRQIENELTQSGIMEPKTLPAKRGRKSAVAQAAIDKAESDRKAAKDDTQL